jgi:hypothetical protein
MAHQHPPRFLKIVDERQDLQAYAKTNVDAAKPASIVLAFILVDVREEGESLKTIFPARFTWAGIIERHRSTRPRNQYGDDFVLRRRLPLGSGC